MSNLQQTKLVNVRISPQIYKLFKKKVEDVGLNPSSFLRHVIISMAIGADEDSRSVPFKRQYKLLIDSLAQREMPESEAFDLIEKERKASYNE